MQYIEFKNRIIRELKGGAGDDDYRRIQWVYENCPLFDDVYGKDRIADIYDKHGMPVIEVLYTATRNIMKAIIKDENYSEWIYIFTIFVTGDLDEYRRFRRYFNAWTDDCKRQGEQLKKYFIDLPEWKTWEV